MKQIRFLDHTPLFVDHLRKQHQLQYGKNLSRHDVINVLISRATDEIFHSINVCCTEDDFIHAGKPFFNVYPRVIDALVNTPLSIRPSDIPKSVIHELGTIAIKFPIGCPIQQKYSIGWFFISLCDGLPGWDQPAASQFLQLQDRNAASPMLFVAYPSTHFNEGQFGNGYVNSWGVKLDRSFDESNFVYYSNDDTDTEEAADRRDVRLSIARIALGVMMLAADPDFIKPVLLKADEGKTTPLEERIARAKKRGVYGFTIGEDIETCPHFRRPHFAVRWTGKGATIPKLVPVKGSVVNKKLMTTVPTGYEST